jgi:hypothetical protein
VALPEIVFFFTMGLDAADALFNIWKMLAETTTGITSEEAALLLKVADSTGRGVSSKDALAFG